MELKKVVDTIGLFVKGIVEPERMQDFLNKNQLILFDTLYSAGDFESLRPFSVLMDGHELPLIYFNAGRCPLPIDYFGNPTILTDAGERTQIVKDDKDYDELVSHKIEYPTEKYPIAQIKRYFIRLLPETIRYCTFSYITKPSPVRFGFTSSRGYVEYAPNSSVELAWNDTNIIKIILLTLNDFGVIANENDVKSKLEKQ